MTKTYTFTNLSRAFVEVACTDIERRCEVTAKVSFTSSPVNGGKLKISSLSRKILKEAAIFIERHHHYGESFQRS